MLSRNVPIMAAIRVFDGNGNYLELRVRGCCRHLTMIRRVKLVQAGLAIMSLKLDPSRSNPMMRFFLPFGEMKTE